MSSIYWLNIIFGVLIVTLLWLIYRRRVEECDKLEVIAEELRQLRLGSRARVRPLKATRTNPHTGVEAELVRLGRASKTKRIVVGGDPEAEQSRALGKRAEEA